MTIIEMQKGDYIEIPAKYKDLITDLLNAEWKKRMSDPILSNSDNSDEVLDVLSFISDHTKTII